MRRRRTQWVSVQGQTFVDLVEPRRDRDKEIPRSTDVTHRQNDVRSLLVEKNSLRRGQNMTELLHQFIFLKTSSPNRPGETIVRVWVLKIKTEIVIPPSLKRSIDLILSLHDEQHGWWRLVLRFLFRVGLEGRDTLENLKHYKDLGRHIKGRVFPYQSSKESKRERWHTHTHTSIDTILRYTSIYTHYKKQIEKNLWRKEVRQKRKVTVEGWIQ